MWISTQVGCEFWEVELHVVAMSRVVAMHLGLDSIVGRANSSSSSSMS